MYKVYTIGEYIIDFLDQRNQKYIAQAGGAPANVAACVAKLGGSSALITTLGKDIFYNFLMDTMKEANVETTYIDTIERLNMLAFVHLDQNGDREFSFYKNNTANLFLEEETIKQIPFDHDILHFCSVSLQGKINKSSHLLAIELVNKYKGLISFDPNIRTNLWDDVDEMKSMIMTFLPYANFIKVSEEELYYLTGLQDEHEAVDKLWHKDTYVIWVTKGKNGVSMHMKNKSIHIPGVSKNPVDTTGAGDAFIGAILYGVQQLRKYYKEINFDELEKITDHANKIAALTTTRFGAISSYNF